MSRIRYMSCAALGVAGIVVASCAEVDDEEPAVMVVDSAGVEMITSSAPLWGSGGHWSVSASPTLEIGGDDGREEYSLFRAGAVFEIAGGRIAIVNSGTSQIRIYSGDGEHLRDVGRQGDGPGEFSTLGDAWLTRGDSIMTSDSRLSRITVFDSEGVLGRTIPVPPHGSATQVFGRRPFDDGSLLVSGVVRPAAGPREGLFEGGERVFSRYSPEGVHEATIGEVPHPANWGFSMRGSVAFTVAPFTVFSPPNASDGEAVFLGSGAESRIEKRSAEGQLMRVIEWGITPESVTPATIDQFRDERLNSGGPPEAQAMVAAMLDGMIYPENLPVYQSLLVDSENCLWVEQYRAVRDAPRRWWVFDAEGRWLGEPPIPTDLDLREVGSDYILGVRADANGVEQVVRYGLSRGS